MVLSGHFLRKINFTHVMLIPKVKDATKMTQLRPISLCNVLYKIVAKVPTNRLKVILPRIIAPTQSVFIPGHLISDNYLVAAEAAHYMHKTIFGVMALKLDISKVYDRVELRFLEAMMSRMGFSNMWISMIMLCVTTMTYSFKLNGESVCYVNSGKGYSARGPLFTLFVYFLCRRSFDTTIKGGKQRGAAGS